ncbi:hypothetical protein GCM10027048_28430 [Hymenobacter coalescens]
MKPDNIILEKSYTFSVRIIRLYQHLVRERCPLRLADQIVGSGTAVGSNVEEAVGGQSRRDFVSKCSIAYKEARETHYWLRLLRDTNYLTLRQANSLLQDCEELLKILTAIIRSSKENL